MTTKTLLLPVFILGALAGCTDDGYPEGNVRVMERCVRPGEIDAAPDADAGGDTNDSEPDGSDCECMEPTPLCNDDGECVECLVPSDCDEPNESLCLGGVCSGCRDDTECAHLPNTQWCNVGAAVCVQCRVDEHCEGGICVDEACVSVGCLGDGDCGGARCDMGTNECVECLSGGDCDSGACGDEGSCLECANDDHCEGLMRCDVEAGSCVSCVEADDCFLNSASVCEAGSCVGCSEDDECGHIGLAACDAGECVDCTDNTHCEGDTPACDTEANTCVGCRSSDDCGGSTPVCDVPNQACVACDASDDSACGAFVCDVLNQTCSTTEGEGDAETCEPCLSDVHCSGDQVCALLSFGATSEGGRCVTPVSAAPSGDCRLADPRMSAKASQLLNGSPLMVCSPNATSCTFWLQDTGEIRECLGETSCGLPTEADSTCYGVAGCASACDRPEDCWLLECIGGFCVI